jgi:hypothetical protein
MMIDSWIEFRLSGCVSEEKARLANSNGFFGRMFIVRKVCERTGINDGIVWRKERTNRLIDYLC